MIIHPLGDKSKTIEIQHTGLSDAEKEIVDSVASILRCVFEYKEEYIRTFAVRYFEQMKNLIAVFLNYYGPLKMEKDTKKEVNRLLKDLGRDAKRK